MDIATCTLDDVGAQTGTVVVIDVLRAFTTAAVGLAGGAASWELVATVAEAHRRREADRRVMLVGEVDGRTAPGFDHGNSPTLLADVDLHGRHVVHRSTAGTQGVVRAGRAARVFAASFSVASATARAITDEAVVRLCLTGVHSGRDGDEDRACADYLTALLGAGGAVPPDPYVARVARSDAARLFTLGRADMPAEDVEASTWVDRQDFAMEVDRGDGRCFLRRVPSPVAHPG